MIKFLVSNKWNAGAVAERLTPILTGLGPNDSGPPWWDEESNKFQLDCGNNWWLRRGDSGEYTLTFRYCTDEWQAALDSLVPFLELIFK